MIEKQRYDHHPGIKTYGDHRAGSRKQGPGIWRLRLRGPEVEELILHVEGLELPAARVE